MNNEQKIIERTTRGRVRIYTWKRRPANAYAPFFLDMLCRELRRTEEEDGIACVVLKSGLPGVFSSGLELPQGNFSGCAFGSQVDKADSEQ